MYDVSVIIPAYNEAEIIKTTIDNLINYFELTKMNAEIIVSDDGSTDPTAAIAQSVGGVRVLTAEHNRGKGSAVRRGLAAANGAAVVITDADGAYKPCNIGYALPHLAHCDAVFGKRRFSGDYPPFRRAASLCYRTLASAVLGIRSVDFQCGFKVLSHCAAKYAAYTLREDGFAYDAELAKALRRGGYTVSSIYITVAEHGKSHVRFLGDTLKMLSALMRIRNEK